MEETVPELAVGSMFAGYLVEGVAGAGGMGVVYRARQVALDRVVAVKLISSQLAGDQSFRERFQREAQVTASIDHPNVIPVYEAGEHDGQLYLVMKYVEGTDLGAAIAREGRLPTEHAARIVSEVAAALDAAHAAGLVHRDIKPGNVLISGSPGSGRVYLTDFGLTKRAASNASLTGTGHWVGTLHYVPPEQIRGQRVDARADVYSLGCLLYEALTGAVPFEREDEIATMFAHMQDEPPLPSARTGVADFDAIVRRAMAKAPDDRYQSAGDLGRAALAAAAHRPISQPERSVAIGPASADPAQQILGNAAPNAPPPAFAAWNPPPEAVSPAIEPRWPPPAAPPLAPPAASPSPQAPREQPRSPFDQPSRPAEPPADAFGSPNTSSEESAPQREPPPDYAQSGRGRSAIRTAAMTLVITALAVLGIIIVALIVVGAIVGS
jgi:serine/threonine-protein kinase